MLEISLAIRVYSEMNSQIDLVVYIGINEDLEKVQSILQRAWKDWWDLENNPELQYIPIGDYISEQLKRSEVDFEIYYKN